MKACMKCKWEGETLDGELCPNCQESHPLPVNYTPEVDRMFWAYPQDKWEQDDWIELARAALDQAGWSPDEIKQIKEVNNKWL